MRSEGWDRPVVTADSFPAGTTNIFMTPALSPGADRLVYTRGDKDSQFVNWISSVSGGPPVRLTSEKGIIERGGSWSPDAARVVYWRFSDGKASLAMVKTTGEAKPVILSGNLGNPLPDWSPDGQWISFLDGFTGAGWTLISPDGKTVRTYGELNTVQVTFSADSKRLYGVRVEKDQPILFSIDIATKETKTIGDLGRDFIPSSYSNPGIRLSLSPDGKSIVFPAQRRYSSLWMLEGFEQPTLLERLKERLPW
jgi:Tol biopolymer transport system component